MPIFEANIVEKNLNGNSSPTQQHTAGYYLAVAAILFYKYSGARDESAITISIQNQKLSISVSPASGIDDILKFIPADIQSTGFPMSFTWHNDYPVEEKYTATLTSLNDDIALHIEAPFKAFFADTVKDSAAHYVSILKQIDHTPGIAVTDINLLSADRLAAVLAFSYGATLNIPAAATTLHQLFNKSVATYKDHVAVDNNGIKISYAQLNTSANKAAHYFIKHGFKKGDGIGLLLPRGVEAYIMMLGALKAGCYYIPLDKKFPPERIAHILDDAGINTLITDAKVPGDVTCLMATDVIREAEQLSDKEPVLDVQPTDTAYMIYTSGSTGLPKGVVIQHKSIVNLIYSECDLYKLHPGDRVAQGLSLAFDASLEEIWMGWANGAALIPIADEIIQNPQALVMFLKEKRITLFSTVPSLLSTLHDNMPLLRILILGGEVCPDALLLRWHTPGRDIYNTYGPTEATVVATAQKFRPDVAITIGKPIANYAVFVVDDALHPVPIGVPGELCIAGAGVAKGYNNKPALTASKFCALDWVPGATYAHYVYRTGDLVRWNTNGEIEFLGRTDNQVKLRGFRIELGEIERVLSRHASVRQAAVELTTDTHNVKQLTAYIVTDSNISLPDKEIRQWLAQSLPAYMLPSVYVYTLHLPVLPSGKVDRKRLHEVEPLQLIASSTKRILPATPTEEIIYTAWKKYLPTQDISTHDNFFDAGGHSLLAALIISELREQEAFAHISVGDVYTYPTVAELAAFVLRSAPAKHAFAPAHKAAKKIVSKGTKFFVQLAQLLAQLILYGIPSGLLVFLYITFEIAKAHSLWAEAVAILGAFVLSYPAYLLCNIITKWLIIGKVKEGEYPVWGWYYFRFWLMRKISDAVPLYFIHGTPFLVWYMRAMGAKIGKRVYLNTDRIKAYDLVHIGDDCSINKEAHIMGYTIEEGTLVIKSIHIGNSTCIDTRTVLTPGSHVAANVFVKPLTLIDKATITRPYHAYFGSPAQEEAVADYVESTFKPSAGKYALYILLHFMAVVGVLTFLAVLTLPFSLFTYDALMNADSWYEVLGILFGSAASFVIIFCALVASLKWILLGRMRSKRFSVYSFIYVRKWTIDTLMYFSLMTLRQLYATLYMPVWLRMMGVKIGKQAEVSTLNQINTDALSIGAGSFLADSVSIGSPQVSGGIMHVQPTVIGERTFIGNGAVVDGGTHIGSNALLGVLSTPPEKGELPANTDWLGSPSFRLPRRQPSQAFPESVTFSPRWYLILLRSSIEFFKVTVPIVLTTLVMIAFYESFYRLRMHFGLPIAALVSPVIMFLLAWMTVLFTVINKYIFIGRYKPGNHPLWSRFVWLNEYINGLCEVVVNPLAVAPLLGTRWAAVVYRMLGSHFGNNVILESTELTEFDLVHVGNNACINFGATIQTHLFEDRVMKKGKVLIDDKCSVGAMSVVLYNSHMATESNIESLSLLMKGESLPHDTCWKGIPARRV